MKVKLELLSGIKLQKVQTEELMVITSRRAAAPTQTSPTEVVISTRVIR